MWYLLVSVIAGLLIVKYNSTQRKFKNNQLKAGGMLKLFSSFVNSVRADFPTCEILVLTETRVELICRLPNDEPLLFFINSRVGGDVEYFCDNKRASVYTARIIVHGAKHDQLRAYQSIITNTQFRLLID